MDMLCEIKTEYIQIVTYLECVIFASRLEGIN